jgi:hypothetical protein
MNMAGHSEGSRGRAAGLAAPLIAWLILALGLPACGGDDACDRLADGRIERAVDHGAAGQEVAVALSYRDGIPVESDLQRCLSVSGPAVTSTAVARRPAEVSFTLLLVDPGQSPGENQLARAAARAVLAQRPAGERLAVYRWGPETTQVAPFLSERPALEERMEVGLSPAAAPIAPAAEALALAGAALAGLSKPGTLAQRTLVIITPRALPAISREALASDSSLVTWLGPAAGESALVALPAGLRFAFTGAADAAAARLSQRIDAHQRHGHYTVAACGVPPGGEIAVRAGKAPARSVLAPAAEDATPGACDAASLAREGARQARRIELVFTPEQRQAADALHRQRSKENFPLAVRMSPGSAPVAATAHFRGEGTYNCARRNYSVNLAGKSARFVFPGFAQDKFHLVSMCQDRFYLRNLLVLTTLAAEGLFPVPFDLVELVIDGKDQGIYLLLENVADSLRVHQTGMRSVIRRYKVPAVAATVPEVRWVAPPAAEDEAVARYHQILGGVAGLNGEALEAGLRRRLHLDQYLKWTAILNGFQSGDHVDEVFFYATESTESDGTRGDYHLIMGWDQDDAFANCHFQGTVSIHDPAGLLWCSESELDRRIFGDPHLYRRYAQVLGRWLDHLTVERFAGLLRATADRLLARFRNPGVLGAMTELAALNPDAVRSFDLTSRLLENELELLVTQYDLRRQQLRARLETLGAGLPREPVAVTAGGEPGGNELQPLKTEPAPAALDPARVVPAASGSRLAALWVEGADPAVAAGRIFAGFQDRQLGVRCWFTRTPDGSHRCLPARSTVSAVRFQDPACSRPVQVLPANACEPPAYLAVRTGMGCPSAEVLYRLTTPVASPELFARDAAGACSRLPPPAATDAVHALEEVPLTAFVAATAAPFAGGRLVAERLTAEDGAVSPGGWRDASLGHACALQVAADGELRCLPGDLPAVQAGLFADNQCRQPAALGPPSTCSRAEQVLRPQTGRCETRFAVATGGDRAVPHQSAGGRCLPIPGAAPPVYPVAAEIAPATFAGGLTTGVLATAGRLRPLVRGAGDASVAENGFFDDERKVSCFPLVASDGVLRCVPRSEGDLSLFADPACRVPVVSARLGCAPPTVAAQTIPGTCPVRARLHRVGAATFAAVYAREATRCVPAPFPQQSLFRLGPEIPPTDFAALELTAP